MANVKEILQKKGSRVVTVHPNRPVMEAVRLMNEHKIGAVVVLDKETVVGVFTERDLLTRVVSKGKNPEKTDIGEVMSTPVAYCTPETELDECRSVITEKRIRHLPVVDQGRLVGLISIGDLMAWEIADHQSTIQYLKEYIYGRS